jgi:hypothetical protein
MRGDTLHLKFAAKGCCVWAIVLRQDASGSPVFSAGFVSDVVCFSIIDVSRCLLRSVLRVLGWCSYAS